MRAEVHDATAKFRVSADLLTAAEQKAKREGMSLSELLRHALRREVRGSEPCDREVTRPDDLLPDAASGNLMAQRRLVATALAMLKDEQGHALLLSSEMLLFARLCAAHGNDDDKRLLAASLCWYVEACAEHGLDSEARASAAEAMAMMDELADDGDELSGYLLQVLADNSPPEIHRAARELRETVQ